MFETIENFNNKEDNKNMLEVVNKEKEIEVRKCILGLEKHLKRKLFCMIQIDDSIDYPLFFKISECLDALKLSPGGYFKNIVKLEKNQDLPISILISSSGGDIDAAYKIVNAFYEITQDIEMIVFDAAKSAATFICLGARKIHMSIGSELGPLDAQLRDPSGFSEPKSAINSFKSLEYLRQYTLETLNQIVLLLINKARMDVPYALKNARHFVRDIVNPLYNQIDPMELGDSRRKLAIAERYSKIIMRRYGYSDYSERKINDIVKELVWGYPSHGFVIDIQEAKSLGLKVELLDDKSTKICDNISMGAFGCIGYLNIEKEEELNGKEQ